MRLNKLSIWGAIFTVLVLTSSCTTDRSVISSTTKEQRVYYTMLIWHKKKSPSTHFDNKLASILSHFNIKVEQDISSLTKMEADGKNEISSPDNIKLLSTSSMLQFTNLLKDQQYQILNSNKNQEATSFVIIPCSTEFQQQHKTQHQVYGVGLFYLEKNGRRKLRKFEAKAESVFSQYHLKINHQLIPKEIQGINKNINLPDEIQFMSIRTMKDLQDLFKDADFQQFLSIRNEATKSLVFYIGV